MGSKMLGPGHNPQGKWSSLKEARRRKELKSLNSCSWVGVERGLPRQPPLFSSSQDSCRAETDSVLCTAHLGSPFPHGSEGPDPRL